MLCLSFSICLEFRMLAVRTAGSIWVVAVRTARLICLVVVAMLKLIKGIKTLMTVKIEFASNGYFILKKESVPERKNYIPKA